MITDESDKCHRSLIMLIVPIAYNTDKLTAYYCHWYNNILNTVITTNSSRSSISLIHYQSKVSILIHILSHSIAYPTHSYNINSIIKHPFIQNTHNTDTAFYLSKLYNSMLNQHIITHQLIRHRYPQCDITNMPYSHTIPTLHIPIILISSSMYTVSYSTCWSLSLLFVP